MEIPILNLSHFAFGSDSQRAAFLQLLVDGFVEYGFLKLINHGFSEDAIHELFDKAERMLCYLIKDVRANPTPRRRRASSCWICHQKQKRRLLIFQDVIPREDGLALASSQHQDSLMIRSPDYCQTQR